VYFTGSSWYRECEVPYKIQHVHCQYRQSLQPILFRVLAIKIFIYPFLFSFLLLYGVYTRNLMFICVYIYIYIYITWLISCLIVFIRIFFFYEHYIIFYYYYYYYFMEPELTAFLQSFTLVLIFYKIKISQIFFLL